MQQNIFSLLSRVAHSVWALFLLLASVIFLKDILFHWFCFRSIIISSLWKEPLYFLMFYIPKVAPAITIASFVFVTKNKLWTIILNFCLDMWILANLIYYRSNELFINIEALKMTDNMNGFWDSVWAYFQPIYLIFFVFSLIYTIMVIHITRKSVHKKRMWKQFIILFVFSIILHILSHSYQYSYTPSATNADKEDLQFVQVQLEGNSFNYPYKSWRLFIPFRRLYIYSRFPIFYWIPIYVREHSISQYAFAMCMQEVFRPRAQNVKMPEISDIQRCLCLNNDNKQQPTSNLIIILFESLESWVFENNQIEIAPNIASILLENHVLYCPFIKSQVRQGTSGDGQMTVNTGLLATQVGAACILYDNNTYPNYAHFYDSTYIFNPAPSSWKQDKATHNYGYKKLIQRNSIKWEDDASTLRKLDSILQQKPTSLCALAITINSHTPFEMVPIHPAFTELNTPKYVKKYMSCVHYTDSCLGKLINGIKTNPELKNTTIVITGDHTIFKSAMLDEFRKQKGEIDLPKMSFVPLIIYSPNIENNVCVEDTCYQMDIYPTIMHLIGCENYYWKGLGVNLLDTTARKNRSINEKEAFALSDMLIRSNYFATIEQ